MGKQFRVRVQTKKAAGRIRKGESSSSCPSYSKNRDIAKAARNAFKQKLIAIDDMPEPKKRRHNDIGLDEPLENMGLKKKEDKNELKKSKAVHFVDEISDDEEKKETESYPNVVITPVELDNKLTLLGQALTSAVAKRSNQRTKIMSEIRSLLKKVEALGSTKEHSEVVSKYSKSFLPIFFRLYTEAQDKINENGPFVSERDIKNSAFETVRIYLPFTPADLVDVHVNLALKKLKNDTVPDEKKMLVANILIVLCSGASSDAAEAIFTYIHTWFLMDPKQKSLQKKAYRILSEFYKRHTEAELAPFFEKIQSTVLDILRLDATSIAEPAWASRLAVFRYILSSLDSLEKCEQFYNTLLPQIIIGLDRSHNALARKNAAKCFVELINSMLKFSSQKEEQATLQVQILDSVEARIFEFSEFNVKSVDVPFEKARATLIAMNIFAQKHLKTMNGALVSRFLNHSTLFLRDTRPVIRVLAIRLIRIFCKKLPDFMLTQFQDYILESVFAYQPEKENTMTIRKANRFLFEIMIEKFGYEVVCKYAIGHEGLLKFMKRLEKSRRRKMTPRDKKTKFEEDDDEEEEDDDGQSEAISALTTSKTLRADSIFDLLEHTDDEESDEDDEI